MSRKHVSDIEVVRAVVIGAFGNDHLTVSQIITKRTGQPDKVAYAAMARCVKRGYINYGVSIRRPWITDKGRDLIDANPFDFTCPA